VSIGLFTPDTHFNVLLIKSTISMLLDNIRCRYESELNIVLTHVVIIELPKMLTI